MESVILLWNGLQKDEFVINEDGVSCKVIQISDANLEQAIREWIEQPSGYITDCDLTNLKELDLHESEISDISPLADMTNLTSLDLFNNEISNISPLAGLTNLTGSVARTGKSL